MRLRATFASAAIVAFAAVPLSALDADRDFSGRWVLDPQASTLRSLPALPERNLTVEQNENSIHCTATFDDHSESSWTFTADGQESRYTLDKEQRKTVGKWEGAALMLDTLVAAGSSNYTIMDRWQLSKDHLSLTIERQVIASSGESDGTIVYHRDGQTQLMWRPAPQPLTAGTSGPRETPGDMPRLKTPPAAPPAPAEFVVHAGTRIPLTLVNALNTKQSHDGDGVYLQTAFPIFVNGRAVIPRGSYVQGTVTRSQPAKGKDKGELYIRFDSLTLPNGVARDFLARLDSADRGKVDQKEGTITGEGRSGASQAGTVVRDTGMGAGIGSLGGLAAGHMGAGIGIGAAAGGIAGLASVMGHRNDGVVLPKGTSMEMVLDRDLIYTADELRF
ncbi:MAG TPA: hypothetical protein VMU19_12835 [Bryobacteraceae bacterium]|nr:hypothetical protein [Bryobacteraceae bacterium]